MTDEGLTAKDMATVHGLLRAAAQATEVWTAPDGSITVRYP